MCSSGSNVGLQTDEAAVRHVVVGEEPDPSRVGEVLLEAADVPSRVGEGAVQEGAVQGCRLAA